MTVARLVGTQCAVWTYVDERHQQSWTSVMQTGPGQWIQVDDSGASYNVTAAKLRQFIDEWIADADIDAGVSTPYPCHDVVEVYRHAAAFIESAGASG